MFSTFDISGSALGLSSIWMSAIAHNLANANTITAPGAEPFRALIPVIQEAEGGGVELAGLVQAQGPGPLSYEPGHPLADENGYVQHGVLDLASQMVDMIVASRSYQANLRSVESAKEMYQAALRLGR